MYSSLIAKFDFPIYKTDATIKAEQDSVTRSFEPYYNYDDKVERTQISRFLDKYKGGIDGVPISIVSVIADRLHRLYQAGVMHPRFYSPLAKDSMSMIRVVQGKSATSTPISCIYSTMSAYEKLFSDEKLAAHRQTLQRCNLNEYIEPNLEKDNERCEAEIADLMGSIPLASGMVLSARRLLTGARLWTTTPTACSTRSSVRPRGAARPRPPFRAPLPDRPSLWPYSSSSSHSIWYLPQRLL